jgi:hypothetical protein
VFGFGLEKEKCRENLRLYLWLKVGIAQPTIVLARKIALMGCF